MPCPPSGREDPAVPPECDHERAACHGQRPLHGDPAQRGQRHHLWGGGPQAEGQDEEGVHRYVWLPVSSARKRESLHWKGLRS